MIEWKLINLPPLNLWNYPKQPDLSNHKAAINGEQDWISYCEMDISKSKDNIEHHKRMIKEKSFIYYLRSGRFPDE